MPTTVLRIARVIAHAAALTCMAYGYLSLPSLPNDKRIRQQTGGHWQFLTLQGLAVAFITVFLSLLVDLFPGANLVISVKRTVLMGSLALSSVVSTIYWSLIALAPNLILRPIDTDPTQQVPRLGYLPLDVDLALHAAPAVALLLEFFLLERKYSAFDVTRVAPFLLFTYSTSYCIWIEYTSTMNKTFPYPFLNTSLLNRLAIYISATLFAYISFRILNALRIHSTGHGSAPKPSSSSSARQGRRSPH
ncbi:hypothetical protein BS47DRAFT_18165 [Hydnum rufescens UP504]|uniref:FAR-17a/AIG1-like protein n=1 Tax=Hydnum rufescens UP504 TaxID=1448309 RepID=A0A9P6E2L0_9AGAM|nr:hypothetical protein BS47DRAFT_18165 [Hydnum rufescens UP504]